ncbi:MAG: FAD-binding protein [Clostridia bacterium]|nr:FAD-binding protein [Clostridia bacterium]
MDFKKIEENRQKNIEFSPSLLDEKERDSIVRNYHPDFNDDGFGVFSYGANKGERAPKELLERLKEENIFEAQEPEYNCDVLVIGGGGAGAAAALEAQEQGASVIIVTKSGFGVSNTIMAEGGMQSAIGDDDSVDLHFSDSFKSGGRLADKKLLETLTGNGKDALLWLIKLGVCFDRDNEGKIKRVSAGGTTKDRIVSSKDFTGLEIMRTLRDEVLNRGIHVLEYTKAVKLAKDNEDSVCGAVICDLEKDRHFYIQANSVVIATGGAGGMHYQGFESTNYAGATADGVILAYNAGAHLVNIDSLQYHPTGACYPDSIKGRLITEKARSLGAKLVNSDGEVFINPLEDRRTVTASILKECKSKDVYLDTPMIDILKGDGTIVRELPQVFRMYINMGIDIRKTPILVYPTLHYQNGGVEIDENARVKGFKNLFAAGEVTGGIHGNNRLMGNALLEIIVFGRIAGRNAYEKGE